MKSNIMELFDEAYKQDTYLDFLAERFNFCRIASTPVDNNEIERFEKLGEVTTKDDEVLLVFEIHTKPDTQLGRNRVQLRNLVAKEIQTEEGALAVYIDAPNQQWRFSFIAIERTFGVTPTQTASKRFTYLLGKNTQTRTAKARFKKIDKQSSLENLKEAFAVEPLNKEFYDKLYKWYQKAQTQVIFPNDEQAENHTQTSLIRLLTRLLFIWFIKEKKLINADLFDKDKLRTLIHYRQPCSFYKAILQNLFFATLSTEIKNRDFTNEAHSQGKNKDYGNQYRYRYHALVKDETKWIASFSQTPFLNGGLFESLDRKLNSKNADDKKLIDGWDANTRPEKTMLLVDGFSQHKDNPIRLENTLFFNNEDSGLIDLFSQYQFTVEESTPLDIEVALDPELLGKVFENLLASYNRETGQQARKATGSFYTPREIVSYMVDESLKQYFKQHTNLDESQINDLFIEKDITPENTLDERQTKELTRVIDNLKILDPAVGSGAYPMGILQRLVLILEKIDPENIHFKQQQIYTAGQIQDKASRDNAIAAIEQVFSQQNQHNAYGKKLYLIEHCIYGVDIQPIAILIAQLRFFISLTIEQTPNNHYDKNFGIRPLPNLDYHFEVGNSLIGLPNDYLPPRVEALLQSITPLKHLFFSEHDHNQKSKIKKEIKDKTNQCYQEMEESIGYQVDFDFKIDFSEVFKSNNGFNIIIGNPPYIRHSFIKESKPKLKKAFSVFTSTADIYTYFYEKGVQLLSDNGHLCYITSNKWMRTNYGEKLRGFFKDKTQLKQIIDFEGEQIFENATVDTNILLCGKTQNTQPNFAYQKQLPNDKNPLFSMAVDDLSENAYTLQAPEILAMKKKIEQIGTPLKEWDIRSYRGVITGFNTAFIIDTAKKEELVAQDPKSAEIIKPILIGSDIEAYEHHWEGGWIINSHNGDKNNAPINIEDYPAIKNHLNQHYPQLEKRQDKGITPYNLRSCAYLAEFAKEKIVWQEIVQKGSFFLDKSGSICGDSGRIMIGKDKKFLLPILNSKLFFYAVKTFYGGGGLGKKGVRMKHTFFEKLPIPKTSKAQQQPFKELVDKIIKAKQNNTDTTALEAEIDQMVYKLYNLTKDEIDIIEDAP